MILAKCLLCQYDDEEECSAKSKNLTDFLLGLPDGASTPVSRFFKSGSPDVEAYTKIIGKFVKNELDISTVPSMFADDSNVGMLKRLVPVMRWRKFRSIGKIYSAIPMKKLASKLALEEKDCVEFLIQVAMKQETSQDVRAPIEFTVDEEGGVVYFDVEDQEEELEGRIEKCMMLAKRVTVLDVAIASSTKYQMNVLKSIEKGSGAGSGSAANARSVVELS